MRRSIGVLRSCRLVAVAVAVAALAAACGSEGASGPDVAPLSLATTLAVPSTVPAPSTTLTASTLPLATDPPDPTTPTGSPTIPDPASSEPASEADAEAPAAPTNLTCSPGGVREEILVEWDAPPDPDDIVEVRVYIDDGSGLALLQAIPLDSGQVLVSLTRWSAFVYPVPTSGRVRVSVTAVDAAGNESGGDTIDVLSDFSGADCLR